MKKFILFIIFVNAFVLKSQNLEYFFNKILSDNIYIKALKNKYSSSLEEVKKQGYWQDPKLSMGFFAMPVETKLGPQNFKLSLIQSIPWFGLLSTKESIAKGKSINVYLELENIKDNLFYEFENYYYQLLEVKEAESILNNNLKLLEQLKNLAQSKYKQGFVDLVDVLRINIEIENTKNDLNSIEEKNRYLKYKINSIISTQETDFLIDAYFYKINLEDYQLLKFEEVLENNIQLKIINNEINISKLKIDLSVKNTYPKFALGLDYAFVSDNGSGIKDAGRDIFMPMLSFNIPIFYGKYTADKQKNTLIYDMKNNVKDDFIFRIKAEYENIVYDIKYNKDKIELYSKNIKSNEQIKKLLVRDYVNSNRNFEEVIRVQQEDIKYKLLGSKAKKDYLISFSKLKKLNSYNKTKKTLNK